MKLTKSTLSVPLVLLLSALYITPTAFAGATNSGGNTSATPGENSSTTTTPADPADPTAPMVAPDTPAATTNTNNRSDTSKATEMKSKTMKDCDVTKDRNCDKTRAR